MDTRWNWENLKEVGILVVGILLIFSMYIHNKDLDRNHEADLRDRAVACRIQLGLGIPLAENCLDQSMTKYFDRNEKVTTAAFRAACEAQVRNNHEPTEGCPDEPTGP